MEVSLLDNWQQMFQQTSQVLLEKKCYRASGVKNLSALQSSFQQMLTLYNLSQLSDNVQSFRPSLRKLESFVSAITLAAQSNDIAGLVWGVIQAVVEVRRPLWLMPRWIE